MTLADAFKQMVFKKKLPDSDYLVPLMIWTSGSYLNIENTQLVNKRFFKVSKDLLMRSLLLNNKVKKFLRYPKVKKNDDKLKFFYDDVCKYYGWTNRELRANIKIVKLEQLKPIIAENFAYENKQRKLIGLQKLDYR